jgi:hypothetical protein
MLIKILLLVPLVIVVAWLWFLTRSVARGRRQLSEAESRLARRFYTLQGRVTEIGATVTELDFEARRARGDIQFRPSMRLEEALAVHPKVREIFAAFGFSGSGCSGPGLDESRTISEACAEASLDSGAVMAALRRFLEDPAGPIEARDGTARLYQLRGGISRDD